MSLLLDTGGRSEEIQDIQFICPDSEDVLFQPHKGEKQMFRRMGMLVVAMLVAGCWSLMGVVVIAVVITVVMFVSE